MSCKASCDKIVYSDASGHAYGVYNVEGKQGIAQGMWNLEETTKSSSWREMMAVQSIIFIAE